MPKKLIILNLALVMAALGLAYFGFKIAQYQEIEIREELKKQTLSSARVVSETLKEIFSHLSEELEAVPELLERESGPVYDRMVFLFDAELKIIYPEFKTYSRRPGRDGFSDGFLERFFEMERLETAGDLEKALEAYEGLLKKISAPQEQALVQFSLARVLKKKGDRQKALLVYQGILEQYPDSFSPDGLNLDIIARYEVIRLAEGRDDFQETVLNARLLLEDIQGLKLNLSLAEKFYWTDRLFKIMDQLGLEKNKAEIETLEKIRENIQKEEEFSEKAAFLQDMFKTDALPETDEYNNLRVRRLDDNNLVFFKKFEDKRYGTIIAAAVKKKPDLDRDFRNRLKTRGLGEDIRCEVEDMAGNSIWQTEPIEKAGPTLTLALKDELSGLRLSLYHQRAEKVEASSRKRKMINMVTVTILFIIIILSGILNLSITLKEMELSRMKTNFISSVSHEMRLPLSTIKTANEMFSLGKVRDNEQARRYYEYIAAEINRLEHLVGNILDFSRLEAGRKQYHFREENLAGIVKETINSVRDYFKKEGFEIEGDLEADIRVYIDAEAVRQAVLNLLDNARKYSGTGRVIKVRLFYRDKNAVLSIIDTGPGIEKDKINKIFEVFYRAEDEMTRKTKGAGLGLAIVRQIMTAHGGQVTVTGEKGKGSVFSLLFPLTKDNRNA